MTLWLDYMVPTVPCFAQFWDHNAPIICLGCKLEPRRQGQESQAVSGGALSFGVWKAGIIMGKEWIFDVTGKSWWFNHQTWEIMGTHMEIMVS